jgi:hypothetical protein
MEEDSWNIDWDSVCEKIDAEIKKYEKTRIFHDEIWKSPLIH